AARCCPNRERRLLQKLPPSRDFVSHANFRESARTELLMEVTSHALVRRNRLDGQPDWLLVASAWLGSYLVESHPWAQSLARARVDDHKAMHESRRFAD